MEFARGVIGERPWGEVFAAFALDEAGCELVIDDGEHQYQVAFERNAVIAASSPLVGDSAIRVALTYGVIPPAPVPAIAQRLAEVGGDAVDVIMEVTGISADVALQLRRRVIAQAATRTFALVRGRYRVTREVTIPIRPHAAIDIRAVVYSGLRSHVEDDRLARDLACFGTTFVLRNDALDTLAQYGFTAEERPTLLSLQRGATIADLESRHPEIGARGVRSLVYALVACRACDATARASAPVVAQPAARPTGTLPPPAARLTPVPLGSNPGLGPSATGAFGSDPAASWPASSAPTNESRPFMTQRGSRPTIVGPAVASGTARRATPAPTVAPSAAKPAASPAADAPPEGPVVSPAESYERGLALLRDDIPAAILELRRAAQASKDPDHVAALAWAQFCAAPDKQLLAKATRQALTHAIFKSEKPELARFYLGRVERMLGRDKEALEQFRSVVELVPRHAEALAEIRTLEARLGVASRKR